MISLSPQLPVIMVHNPVNFKLGIDGLSQYCLNILKQDPMCQAIFMFRNKSKTSLRLLAYDGQGFILCTKRLSAGKFKFWIMPSSDEKELSFKVNAFFAQTLLSGGDPYASLFLENWKNLF